MRPSKDDSDIPSEALKPSRTILESEVRQAVTELNRPTTGLVMSGLIAGFGIGTSVLAIALFMELRQDFSPIAFRLMIANAYAIGFVLVILSHTDIFTEYTTIALLPVLTGDSRLSSLARLWVLIYAANLIGGFFFVLLLVSISPDLGIASAETFSKIGLELVDHPWWIMLLSATLAGWLMGLMGWMVTSSRDTIGQIVFVWLIAGIIGVGHLHHSILGTLEMFAAMLVPGPVSLFDAGRFLLWVTVGNILGGALFAVAIRYSVLISGEKGKGR